MDKIIVSTLVFISSLLFSEKNIVPTLNDVYQEEFGVAVQIAAAQVDKQKPTKPQGFSAQAVSSSQIDLAWNPSTDNIGVTGYVIQRCQGTNCNNFAQIAPTASTQYQDIGLQPATAYRYRVRAGDAAGNLSTFSATQNATTFDATPIPPPPPPPPVPAYIVNDSLYNAFPSLVRDGLGRLQVYYRAGPDHNSRDGMIRRAISSDGGATWAYTTVIDTADDIRSAKVIRLTNGKLAMVWWKDVGGADWHTFFRTSSDDGETWSSDIELGTSLVWAASESLVEVGGAILVNIYGINAGDERESSWVVRSTDGGATWSSPIAIASAPNTTAFNETSIVIGSSSLFAFIRDETNNKLWRSTSFNSGLSWSERTDVTPSGWQAGFPDVLNVGGATYLIFRTSANTTNRTVSYDGGLTWNVPEVISPYLYEYSWSIAGESSIISAVAYETSYTDADIELMTWDVAR